MNLAIITGTSKGLGEELAKQLLDQNYEVIGLARTKSDTLESQDSYTHLACDLADLQAVESAIEQIEGAIDEKNPETVLLINNAGIVNPINQATEVGNADLVKNFQVNTIAPLVTTNHILKKCNEKD